MTPHSPVTPTAVHNHGPEDGPGLSCKERRIDGKLVGECMMADPLRERVAAHITERLAKAQAEERKWGHQPKDKKIMLSDEGWALIVAALSSSPPPAAHPVTYRSDSIKALLRAYGMANSQAEAIMDDEDFKSWLISGRDESPPAAKEPVCVHGKTAKECGQTACEVQSPVGKPVAWEYYDPRDGKQHLTHNEPDGFFSICNPLVYAHPSPAPAPDHGEWRPLHEWPCAKCGEPLDRMHNKAATWSSFSIDLVMCGDKYYHRECGHDPTIFPETPSHD